MKKKKEKFLKTKNKFNKPSRLLLPKPLLWEHHSIYCIYFSYMAPELLGNDYCGMEADIWAFGCIIYELANGRPLFYSEEQGLVWKKIMDNDFSLTSGEDKVPHLNDIISKILKVKR